MDGCVTPILVQNPNTQSKRYDSNKTCDYHSRMKGYTIETYRDLRDKIQQLIEANAIHSTDLVPKECQQ